jgi:hypothetical protein
VRTLREPDDFHAEVAEKKDGCASALGDLASWREKAHNLKIIADARHSFTLVASHAEKSGRQAAGASCHGAPGLDDFAWGAALPRRNSDGRVETMVCASFSSEVPVANRPCRATMDRADWHPVHRQSGRPWHGRSGCRSARDLLFHAVDPARHLARGFIAHAPLSLRRPLRPTPLAEL